ncbi:DUF599 domain-containing protein [Uliginosibacterium flavum]|uniref:DUF599 domain-containing protein n=1 Tax=Uliginosibacterium flavum TaxID=1396831 RepID=A0ABV2TJG1_9RHOO
MNFFSFFAKFSWVDWLGLSWFLICWFGYERLVEKGWKGHTTLLAEGHRLRLEWARELLTRENRIVDCALVSNLVSSVSFYANTSIYIIAGLFATLGALDRFMDTAAELQFSHSYSREAMELKLVLLITVFVVAYFKFTWALRQFNVLSIITGAVPQKEADPDQLERYAQKHAAANTCAGDDFNRGIRAYYFGMAVLGWMLSPWLFIIATSVIVFVQARREFDSPVLRALREIDVIKHG